MSLIDVIPSRRSIRRYEKKEISKNVLNKILEAGRQAPSAKNKQPWHFIVITDDRIKEKLSQGRYNRFIKDAPITIVGCADLTSSKKWAVVDTAIALQNMGIAAWALGIGSCWIGDFNEKEVKLLLGIPEGWKVVALITFGYPAERPKSRQKKPLEEIVGYNKF